MSEAAIRAKIKTVILTVSGIGQVHDYERHTRSMAKFKELMRAGTPEKVNGCIISRVKTSSDRGNMPNVTRRHTFGISFVYELDDDNASEKTFQALLEAAYQKLKDTDHTLGGTCENIGLLQINDVSVDGWENTLIHSADCTLECIERDTYS